MDFDYNYMVIVGHVHLRCLFVWRWYCAGIGWDMLGASSGIFKDSLIQHLVGQKWRLV